MIDTKMDRLIDTIKILFVESNNNMFTFNINHLFSKLTSPQTSVYFYVILNWPKAEVFSYLFSNSWKPAMNSYTSLFKNDLDYYLIISAVLFWL